VTRLNINKKRTTEYCLTDQGQDKGSEYERSATPGREKEEDRSSPWLTPPPPNQGMMLVLPESADKGRSRGGKGEAMQVQKSIDFPQVWDTCKDLIKLRIR